MPNDPTFEAFGLPAGILEGLKQLGFTHPTPVQEAAIPAVLQGKDLLVQAKTGSGKTLAFGLPLLARLDPQSPDTQVLIITPTRELAIQVAEELNKVGGHMGILVAAIYGGTKMDSQMTDLAWASIIVGTPGRLRDHLTRGNLHLDRCTTVVLDEADEMLDMGFKDDLEFILDGLPKPRVTLLFSATFPKPIEAIARKYMQAAEKIAVSSGLVTPTDISHRFFNVSESHRIDALIALLQKEDATLSLVFCKRKSETTSVARKLRAARLQAGFLNGDMNQAQRIATLDQFKRGEITVLVATDVAARGLDISNISHVFNVSVPMDTETYVHRSGRTGRAGRKGVCVTLVTPEEARSFARIQHDLAENMRKQPTAKGPETPPRAQPVPLAKAEPVRRPSATPSAPRQATRKVASSEATPSAPPQAARTVAPPEAPRDGRRSPSEHADPQEIFRAASGREERFRDLARDLLQQADPEKLVASLLSLAGVGRRMLETQDKAEPQVKAESQPQETRGRGRSGRMRVTRKPSSVVYGE